MQLDALNAYGMIVLIWRTNCGTTIESRYQRNGYEWMMQLCGSQANFVLPLSPLVRNMAAVCSEHTEFIITSSQYVLWLEHDFCLFSSELAKYAINLLWWPM